MSRATALRLALLGSLLVSAAPMLADAPPPLSAYGELPGVETMSISPAGSELAIVARLKGERRLVVLDGERRLRQSLPLTDSKLRGLRWAGDERVLVTLSNTQALGLGFTTSKHEFYGTVVVPVREGKVEAVFSRTQAVARATFGDYGTRFVDGKWIGYYGGVEYKRAPDGIGYEFDHGRPALFGVDLQSNTQKRAAAAPGESLWRDWLIDDRGRVSAMLDVNKSNGRWTIQGPGGTALAAGVDITADVSLIAFSHDGSGVVYRVEDDEAGTRNWYEVPLAGGAPKPIFTDVNFRQFYIDPANGRLLGYLEDGAAPRPVLFDTAKQAVLRKVYRAFPKLNVSIAEWTPSFSHVLAHTSGNGDSGTWYLIDMAKLSADPVGNDYPAIFPEKVGPISMIDYKAADGLDLDGVLTLPPGKEAKNLPLVMMPHGGPHSADEAQFYWWAQAFASRGYAVFQPNFRGSTNRSHAFRRAGYGQWGRKMQTDLSDGLAELAKRGVVDPKRACIVGASYGGYAALAGVTLQNGLYRCAVAVAPVSDLTDMYWTDYRESGDNKVVKAALRESLGDPKTFAEVSPRRHAAKADALRAAGKPHQLIVLKEEDHWLSRSATRHQMLEATVGFVQKNNPAD